MPAAIEWILKNAPQWLIGIGIVGIAIIVAAQFIRGGALLCPDGTILGPPPCISDDRPAIKYEYGRVAEESPPEPNEWALYRPNVGKRTISGSVNYRENFTEIPAVIVALNQFDSRLRVSGDPSEHLTYDCRITERQIAGFKYECAAFNLTRLRSFSLDWIAVGK